MAKYNPIKALVDAGITFDDATALRRISMTLSRWHELECGDSNNHGAWAIETIPVTKKAVHVTSSPACHPRYGMIVPAYTECKQIEGRWVVAETAKIKLNDGSRTGMLEHDLEHHYVWLADADVVELPFMVHHHYMHGRGKDYTTKTRIADRERGARKRLAAIMGRYPGFAAYVQTDPRGASLYILRPEDLAKVAPDVAPAMRDSLDLSAVYTRGIAVYR